jgi:hypothetical protein
MPYSNGKIPMIGDEVSDEKHHAGLVKRLLHSGGEDVELVIEWEDGTVGIRYFPSDVIFVSRQAKEIVSIPQ